MKAIAITPFFALAGCLTACAPHVYSPPGRVNVLESAATLDDGDHSASLSAGGVGAAFGFSALTFAGTYRYGLTDEVQVGGDVNAIVVNRADIARPPSPSIFGVRAHAKWAPDVLGSHVAMTGGIGTGFSPDAGAFVAPDIGLVAAIENPYIVPFVGASAFVSQPFATSPLDLSLVDEEPGTRILEAQTTRGWQSFFGLRIPIEVRGNKRRINIYAAGRVFYMTDDVDEELAIGLFGGPEFVF